MNTKETNKLTWADLHNLTWSDSHYFTWSQFTMDKLELLKNATSEEFVLPDSVWEKLNTLCRKTIEDYNKIVSNKPIVAEINDLPTSKPPYSDKVKERLILLAITIIEAIMLNAISSKPQTTNNYFITVEQFQILQTDVDDITETLSGTNYDNPD